ncbi:MAG: hypothetical protein U9Q97_06770 [Acidobacteriota bacterium]|nr:hypothetical protein [Acidobacteriota bacterium]
MPSLEKHIKQAEKNERFFNDFDLKNTQFLDWAITALFYSALHYVDAYLAIRSQHPSNHKKRGWWLNREQNLRHIYYDYAELKNRSEDARYKILQFPPHVVSSLEVKEFTHVKSHIRSLIP